MRFITTGFANIATRFFPPWVLFRIATRDIPKGLAQMQPIPETMRPTEAETRPAVLVPPPIDGASKELRDEYRRLQARSDALEMDKANAAQHRAAESNDKPKPVGKAVAEETGGVDLSEDGQIIHEAGQIRGLAVELLRTELRLRVDLADYLERWRAECRRVGDDLEAKLEQTRAGIQAELVKLGYVDPEADKLSPFRVTPRMIEAHPAVASARSDWQAAGKLSRDEYFVVNRRKVESLRRLIEREAERLPS